MYYLNPQREKDSNSISVAPAPSLFHQMALSSQKGAHFFVERCTWYKFFGPMNDVPHSDCMTKNRSDLQGEGNSLPIFFFFLNYHLNPTGI